MPVKPDLSFSRGLAAGVALVLVVLMLDGAAHLLMAQTPFGGPRPSGAETPPSGLVAWLLPKLFRFLRGLWSRARERDATLGEKPP